MDRKSIRKRRKKAVRGTFTLSILLICSICPLIWPFRCKAKSIVYRPDFSYNKLSGNIKKRINGVSYHKNPNVKYSDLRYVIVRYIAVSYTHL